MNGKKAILFDFDGTIADTLDLCIAACCHAMSPIIGRELSRDEVFSTFGPSEEGTIAIILERFGFPYAKGSPEFAEAWRKGLDACFHWYRELHEGYCPRPFDGICDLLRVLRRTEATVALVTGKGPVTTRISLDLYEMGGLFDVVETGDADGPNKQRGIRRILESCEVEPRNALYIGDMPSDVLAARECGVETIAAAWASTALPLPALVEACPKAIVHSIDALRSTLMHWRYNLILSAKPTG